MLSFALMVKMVQYIAKTNFNSTKIPICDPVLQRDNTSNFDHNFKVLRFIQ